MMTAYQDDAPLCLDESVFKSAPQNLTKLYFENADDDHVEDLDSAVEVLPDAERLMERTTVNVQGLQPIGPDLRRFPSCQHYEACLDQYARLDALGRAIRSDKPTREAPGWSCSECSRYERVAERDPQDVRLLCHIARLIVAAVDAGEEGQQQGKLTAQKIKAMMMEAMRHSS